MRWTEPSRGRPAVLGCEVALAVAMAACGPPSAALVHQPPDYADERLVVVDALGDDLLVVEGDRLERVRAGGWVARWQLPAADLVLAPPRADGEIWLIDRGGTPPRLTRIDATSGTVRGATDLGGGIGDHRRGDALVRVANGEVASIDPRTGAVRWRVEDGELDPYHFSFSRDAVWMFGSHHLCGFALADGRRRGCLPAEHGYAIAGGDRVVVTAPGEVVAYDATTLAARWRRPVAGVDAPDLAVADRWVAVIGKATRRGNGPETLSVFRASDGEPAWSHTSKPGGEGLGYLAIAGDLLAYFDYTSGMVWAVRLPGGQSQQVRQYHRTFVLAEHSGWAPAVPDGAPRILGDFLVLERLGDVWIYRAER